MHLLYLPHPVPFPKSAHLHLHPPPQIPPCVEAENYLQNKLALAPTEFVTDYGHAKPVMEAKTLSTEWCNPQDYDLELPAYSPVVAHINQAYAPSIEVFEQHRGFPLTAARAPDRTGTVRAHRCSCHAPRSVCARYSPPRDLPSC